MATKKRSVESYTKLPKSFKDESFYGLSLDEEQLNFVNTAINPDIDIVFVDSKAGTGKTTLAVGVANLLVSCGEFSNIIYVVSPYGESKQGYMPGTITEKSAVYFEAFYQALEVCGVNPNTAISNENIANQKNGTGYITCITDTFLRGSNLDDAVIILDETQNFTLAQLKKTLTRVCTKVKVIVIGHTLQCDLDKPWLSGFAKCIEHFKDQPRAAVCKLTTNHRSWISRWADELDDRQVIKPANPYDENVVYTSKRHEGRFSNYIFTNVDDVIDLPLIKDKETHEKADDTD